MRAAHACSSILTIAALALAVIDGAIRSPAAAEEIPAIASRQRA